MPKPIINCPFRVGLLLPSVRSDHITIVWRISGSEKQLQKSMSKMLVGLGLRNSLIVIIRLNTIKRKNDSANVIMPRSKLED